MKISDFLRVPLRKAGTIRHRTSYRAARRNIAKIEYRRFKRKYPV